MLNAIVEAERQPIKQLEGRKALEETKNKLFQEFKAKFQNISKALDDAATTNKLRELKVDLGEGEGKISVTVDKEKAPVGSWDVEISQLAERSSMISNHFPDPEEKVLGVGFINLKLANGDDYEIYVDKEDASLRRIASLINAAPESPVQASVIQDQTKPDSPWRLIMTAKQDGLNKDVEFPDFYFLEGDIDFYAADSKEAANAVVKLDGFELELESNDVKDFLQGVNVHLKSPTPDKPFRMTISADYEKVSGKIKGLVDEVNKVLEFINKQNQVDDKTDTRTTFAGDTSLQMIEYRIRNLFHEGFAARAENGEDEFKLVFLHQMGVEFGKNGLLSFNQEKFQKNLEGDFDGVAEAISGPQGFVTQLRSVMEGYTRPGSGSLAVKERAIQDRIKGIDRQIETKERQLEKRQQSLTEQFSRLQSSVGAMQRQSQYLAGALPGAGAGVGSMQQLLGG
jgi:flagellar hook-associated protein 2